MITTVQEAINLLSKRQNLTERQMRSVMEEIMTGKIETEQIVSFLTGLSEKGETIEELTAAVSVMRRYVTKINAGQGIILDTCGTGGDKSGTFNISTCAAFVAAGCGITVAKHGNRSVSSRCGSADILEALGVNINLGREEIEDCLDKTGIAFLFAQNLHPAMKYAAMARKKIGKKTIFNLLGPLSNPAGARHQLIGVYDKRWTETLTYALNNLGTTHCLVVHGKDGLDEITTTAETYICELNRGCVKSYEITPEDFGFKRAKLEELSGMDAQGSVGIILDILNGKAGACRDIVILNAAAAIYAADKVNSIKDGIRLAAESIDSKKALKKLELLKDYSTRNLQ